MKRNTKKERLDQFEPALLDKMDQHVREIQGMSEVIATAIETCTGLKPESKARLVLESEIHGANTILLDKKITFLSEQVSDLYQRLGKLIERLDSKEEKMR